jgi:hypothetical protein
MQFMVSTPVSFGTGLPSSGSVLKQGTDIQQANLGTDHPHCHHQNITILKFKNTQS